jgi:hypothetical protein
MGNQGRSVFQTAGLIARLALVVIALPLVLVGMHVFRVVKFHAEDE